MKRIILQMKGLVLVLAFLVVSPSLNAQTSGITIDASQQFTSFSFQNSEGVGGFSFLGGDDYQGVYSGAYSLGYRYTGDFGLVIRGGIGVRNAGAQLIFDETVNTWSLQYLDLRAAAGYKYDIGKLGVYLTAGPYLGVLLRGTQRLNDERFDVVENESINNIDFGIVASPGVQYDVSDAIHIYSEFTYLFGLKNLETNENGQKSYNVGAAITLGVSFIIK